MLPAPVKADAEVAAVKFREHLALLDGDRAREVGLRVVKQEPMYAVIHVPGVREDGRQDDYYVRLGAEYYDKWPPTAAFVKKDTWEIAAAGSRWVPRLELQHIAWFGLYVPYSGNGIQLPQLLCFTFTAEYYMVPHSPPEDSVWRQGYHTLMATVYRLAEVLGPPHYKGPQGAE